MVTPLPRSFPSPVLAATIAAAALVAQHVIGRATRDAMFLSHFRVARLPVVIIGGALVSSVVVMLMTRLFQRRGPACVVPAALVLHAVGLFVEWALSWRFESAVALIVYVHTASVGATIVSGFWSVVGESFDPHAAKRAIGRVSAGAALGGVAGGSLAWGASKLTGVPNMLLVMMALSLVCAWGIRSLSRDTPAARASLSSAAPRGSAFAVLRNTPYLRLLALVVLVGATMQSLLDYALGVEAAATYGTGARLLSFFAVFQTVIAVVAFLVQTSASRLALDRLGLGGTLALLPGGVTLLGTFALGVPSLMTIALQRGAEGVLRASLFRSAYEVLFTPVPVALKRPTKTAIDVTFDRAGMMVGSGLTLALIAVLPQSILRAVTICAVLAAIGQFFLSYRLHLGYVKTLGERLRSGVLTLDPASIVDATTRRTLSETLAEFNRSTLLAHIDALRAAPQLLDRLAQDDVARDAMRALGPLVPHIIGTIVDFVLDEGRPAQGRRRAARLLRGVSSPRAAHALAFALDSSELDVRHACGRVLLGMREGNNQLGFDAHAMLSRARRELDADGDDRLDSQRLEHTFNVLSLAFDLEPMQLAYGALQAKDPVLRGVALEYLDVVLPVEVRAAILRRLEAARPGPEAARAVASVQSRPSTRSVEELLKSRDAIHLSLDELRRLHDPDAEPSST